MRNPERRIDKTFLSANNTEERQIVHRDLIAHALRWSHVIKHLLKVYKDGDITLVDVGCGKEVPMARMLYSNRLTSVKYVGVDASALKLPDMLEGTKMDFRLFGKQDFCELGPEQLNVTPSIITSFEVIEHVTPEHARRMLIHMRKLIADGGDVMISTPCYNGSAAQNHINEMTYSALGAVIEDLGFAIEGHWGTFASQRDYKPELIKDELMDAFDRLHEYYDSNLIAVLFAPLYPAQARNCFWHLKKNQPADYVRKFPTVMEVPGPWSQHPRWFELGGLTEEPIINK